MVEVPRITAELIYHPKSGRRFKILSNEQYANRVAKRLEREHGWNIVNVHKTSQPGDANKIAAAAARDGRHVVIVIAGDGTGNEAHKSLSGTDTILGVIPRGGINLWARETHTPRRAKKAADALARGVVHDVDTVIMDSVEPQRQEITLSNIAGYGYDGLVFNIVHEPGKERKKNGVIQYFKQALHQMRNARLSPAVISVDDGEPIVIKNLMQLWIHNTQNLAFLRFRRKAKCDDGIIELTAFEGKPHMPRRNVVALAGKLIRDSSMTRRIDYTDEIRLSGRHFRISFTEPLEGEYDGEPLQKTREVEIFVKEGASRRLVPHSRRTKIFSKPGIPLSEIFIPSASR